MKTNNEINDKKVASKEYNTPELIDLRSIKEAHGGWCHNGSGEHSTCADGGTALTSCGSGSAKI